MQDERRKITKYGCFVQNCDSNRTPDRIKTNGDYDCGGRVAGLKKPMLDSPASLPVK